MILVTEVAPNTNCSADMDVKKPLLQNCTPYTSNSGDAS